METGFGVLEKKVRVLRATLETAMRVVRLYEGRTGYRRDLEIGPGRVTIHHSREEGTGVDLSVEAFEMDERERGPLFERDRPRPTLDEILSLAQEVAEGPGSACTLTAAFLLAMEKLCNR